MYGRAEIESQATSGQFVKGYEDSDMSASFETKFDETVDVLEGHPESSTPKQQSRTSII